MVYAVFSPINREIIIGTSEACAMHLLQHELAEFYKLTGTVSLDTAGGYAFTIEATPHLICARLPVGAVRGEGPTAVAARTDALRSMFNSLLVFPCFRPCDIFCYSLHQSELKHLTGHERIRLAANGPVNTTLLLPYLTRFHGILAPVTFAAEPSVTANFAFGDTEPVHRLIERLKELQHGVILDATVLDLQDIVQNATRLIIDLRGRRIFLFNDARDAATYLMTTLLSLRTDKDLFRRDFKPNADAQYYRIELGLRGSELNWSGVGPTMARAEPVLIDKFIIWANKNFTMLGELGLFQLLISADDMPKGQSEARRRKALLSGKAFLRDLVGPKHKRLAKCWCPEIDIDTALDVCVVPFQLAPLVDLTGPA
jgi:hypothetical protein